MFITVCLSYVIDGVLFCLGLAGGTVKGLVDVLLVGLFLGGSDWLAEGLMLSSWLDFCWMMPKGWQKTKSRVLLLSSLWARSTS